MNRFFRAVFIGFVGAAIVASCTSAFSQTTTTLGGLRTGTNGNITQTTTFSHLNITGSDYRMPMSELAKGVLSNLTISNGGSSIFSLTGIITSGTTTLGVLTLTQTLTGVLTSSGLITGTTGSATTSAAIYVASAASGREGIRIISQTGQTANLFNIISVTTGTTLVAVDSAGILWLRNNQPVQAQFGIPGSSYCSISTSPDLSCYFNFGGGKGIGFNPSAGAQGQDSTTPCISSTQASILQVTNTGGSRVGMSMGSVFAGMSALTTSASLTIANTAVTATGVITTTLPDGAAGPAGRMVFITNIGAGNVTVASFTTGQTIDGAGTVTLSGGSGGAFIYNGSTWNRFRMQ